MAKSNVSKTDLDYAFYLKTDLSSYPENSWVAIFKRKIIAHGRRADVVYKKAQNIYPDEEVLMAQVPPRRLVIY